MSEAMQIKLHPQAIDWEVSERERERKRAKLAVGYGVVMTVLFALCAIVLIISIPFQRPYPFTIEIDRLTGETKTTIGYETPVPGSQKFEHMIKRDLINYTKCWAGFSKAMAQHCYDAVFAQSSSNLQAQWVQYFNPKNNPNAPLKIYSDIDSIDVANATVTFLPATQGQYTALVRFDRETRVGNQQASTRRMVATVAFRYVDHAIPKDPSNVWLNPLGLQVLSFKKDTEGSEQNLDAEKVTTGDKK